VNTLAFAFRSLLRDLKAGELSVLLMAIVVAVTAMTAVGFFTDRVARGIKTQASAVLAADLVVRGPAPIKPSFLTEAREAGLTATESMSFLTMVLSGDNNVLTMISAVDTGFPLRGQLLVSDAMFEDANVAEGIPDPGTGWAEAGLLARLSIDVGDTVSVGEHQLLITRVLEYQPNDAGGGMAILAPGLMVNINDVPAFNVIRPGSRATYRELFAGDESSIAKFRAGVEIRVLEGASVRGSEDAGEQINAAIDRAQRFLTLASLVTVILAAIATAMASRRYAMRHLDTIALLKSLGATQRLIQRSTLLQLGFVIIGTATLGSLLGFFAQGILVTLAADLLKIDLPATSPLAGLLGLITAATITIGFALPHLFELKNTTPIRVLRQDLPPPAMRTGATYGVAVLTLMLLIWSVVRDLMLVGLISGGLLMVTALAVAGGWILVKSFTRFRGAAGVAWRYGLAHISRRGPESIVQIVAFAMSLMVLLLLTIVRNDILEEWRETIPEDAPNYFLINIEPDTWPGIEKFFDEQMNSAPDFLPFIRGKVVRINDKPADEADFSDPRGLNFVNRETNLTWRAALPESNRVTAGEWWGDNHGGQIELSLESGLALSLGVGIGDTMGFNVGGVEFDAPVTSLRTIEWDSMRPNFFVMLSPGLSQNLPQTYISSVYVPAEKRRLMNNFVRSFPGVTLLDLEVILGQVRMVIDRASMSVEYVFLFTLLAGLVVLLAAIQATRDERRFESALLHTLGASRKKILQGIAVEFIVLGGLAGALAAFGATAVGFVLAKFVFKLDYIVDPWLWLTGLLVGSVVVGITGTLATRKAVSEPPVLVLRSS
jgi:putative ABC transport system permease protein